MSLHNLLIAILIAFFAVGGQSFRCPPSGQLSPCNCFSWDDPSVAPEVEILCEEGLQSQSDLQIVFKAIADIAKEQNSSLEFDSLRLVGTGLTELSSNVFEGATFRTLDIFGNSKLEYLRPKAFEGSKSTLKSFSVQGSPIGSNRNQINEFFTDLRIFSELESLAANDNQFTSIPADAFNTELDLELNPVLLPNLTLIDLNSNQINSVGANAFRGLPRLNRLILDNNRISKIENGTFGVREPDLKTDEDEDSALLIYIRNNLLKSSSFESGSFSGINRDFLTLYLSNNQMDTLPEFAFKELLDSKESLIAFWQNPLNCDCRAKWLVEGNLKYQRRVHGLFCPDERELWDYRVEELTDCN